MPLSHRQKGIRSQASRSFGPDRDDALAKQQMFRLFNLHKTEEGLDCRKPLVPSRDTIVMFMLKIEKEILDHFSIQIVETQFFRSQRPRISQIGQ